MGALTSKTKSFQARNWELKEYQTVSLSDPFFSPIKVDVRDRKILRILPVVGTEEWINDNTRFFTTISHQKSDALAFKGTKRHSIENHSVETTYKTHEKSSHQEIAKTIAIWVRKTRNLVWIVDEATDANTLAEIKRHSPSKTKVQMTGSAQHHTNINSPYAMNLQEDHLILIKENRTANEAAEIQLINHHRLTLEHLHPSTISIYEFLKKAEGTISTEGSTTIIPPLALLTRIPTLMKTLHIGLANQALSFKNHPKAQIQTASATFMSLDSYVAFNPSTYKFKAITNGTAKTNQNISIHLPSSPLHKGTFANLYGQLIHTPATAPKPKIISLIQHTIGKPHETI